MFRTVIFYSVCTIHCLIWMFVLFAFFNRRMAYINLFYIIPIIYILHIFPIHFLEYTKEHLYPDSFKEKMYEFLEASPFGILKIYADTQDKLDNYCFANPIGPQGMLIFGAISSAYSLRRGKFLL